MSRVHVCLLFERAGFAALHGCLLHGSLLHWIGTANCIRLDRVNLPQYMSQFLRAGNENQANTDLDLCTVILVLSCVNVDPVVPRLLIRSNPVHRHFSKMKNCGFALPFTGLAVDVWLRSALHLAESTGYSCR